MATQAADNPVEVAADATQAVHELTVMLAKAQAPPQVLKALQGCSQVLSAVTAALGHTGPPQAQAEAAGPPAAAGPSTPSSRDQAMQAASAHALAAHAAANQAAQAPPGP